MMPEDCDDASTQRAGADAARPTFGEAPPWIGPYRVLRELGRGGQGLVYLAEDTRLKRQVAVKILTRLGALSDDALRRFRREAELASKLDHPGICPIYDVGTFDRAPYIAMRYVQGETLSARLDSARLAGRSVVVFGDDGAPDSVTTFAGRETGAKAAFTGALELVERVARIAHAAHQRGVVHRDLKPGNLIVDDSGAPVILDFGLARDLTADDPTLTASGEVFGTPAYMAPEQVRGERTIDGRADVYALGVILFELLTLRRPHSAPTREALFEAITGREAPDPRSFNGAISRDLASVVLTALASDRGRRYQTAADLADDLRRVREGEPVLARPVTTLRRVASWARRHRVQAAAIVTAVAAILGGFAASLYFLRGTKAALAEYERLADVKRLGDLVREARTLWPARPATAPAMREWLVRADRLLAGLADHEATLHALRAKASSGSASESRGAIRFAATADQWRHDTLAELVAALRAFGDPASGVRAAVSRRLATAESIERRSVADVRSRWNEAIASIGDRATSPWYGGLRIEPMVGFVPFRKNPSTGLWEFIHLESAAGGTEGAVDLSSYERTPRPAECGLVFVLIPAGSFVMGAVRDHDDAPEGPPANVDPLADSSEAPPAAVALDAFLLSACEMTQAQWSRLAGGNPSRYSKGIAVGGFDIDDRHPVESVGADEVESVLARHELLLPTEAQWEYAARAGTRTPWWTGMEKESLQTPRIAANLADATAADAGAPWPGTKTWPAFRDGFVAHAPTGALAPNPFGLHDVHGNVWELVLDPLGWYDKHPVRAGDGLRIVEPGETSGRIARGGSFAFDFTFSRVSMRYTTAREYKNDDVGVRPAAALPRRAH